MARLREEGCDRLVTLLATREGSERIGALAREVGMEWTWLPLDSGRPPTADADWQRIALGLIALAGRLNQGESVALHCSAGIHRTGMIAYAFLRAYGYTRPQALDTIARMRVVTRSGLTEAHLAFGDALAERMREP